MKSYIKMARRKICKKKAANLLNNLISIMRRINDRDDYFIKNNEVKMIENLKRKLYKYYPKQWVNYNWKHTITLTNAFMCLGVWEAW